MGAAVLISTVVTLGTQASATAEQQLGLWSYGSSTLRLSSEGDRRILRVEKAAVGRGVLVGRGTVLFDGSLSGDHLTGNARAYAPGCAPVRFHVEGTVSQSGSQIVLSGSGPSLDATCSVIGKTPARLIFTAQGATGTTGTAPTTPPPPPPPPQTDTVAGHVQPRCTRLKCVDRDTFKQVFGPLYRAKYGRALNEWQDDALTAVLNVWDTNERLIGEKRLAYILGTVDEESAGNIYPVREGPCRLDEGSVAVAYYLYRKGIAAKPYFQRDSVTHQSYYGRGQVQITWLDNYRKDSGRISLGDRLYYYPDDALRMEISATLAVMGSYDGWFTGRALRNFTFQSDADWVNARTVINGHMNADAIGAFSKRIVAAIAMIDRSEFLNKYGQPEVPPPTETTSPGANTKSTEAPAAAPDTLRTSTLARLDELQGEAKRLEMDSSELILKLEALRKDVEAGHVLEPEELTSLKSAASPAPTGDEVDFKTVWPPGFKESGACRLTGKSLVAEPVLEDDDPLIRRYGAGLRTMKDVHQQ